MADSFARVDAAQVAGHPGKISTQGPWPSNAGRRCEREGRTGNAEGPRNGNATRYSLPIPAKANPSSLLPTTHGTKRSEPKMESKRAKRYGSGFSVPSAAIGAASFPNNNGNNRMSDRRTGGIVLERNPGQQTGKNIHRQA